MVIIPSQPPENSAGSSEDQTASTQDSLSEFLVSEIGAKPQSLGQSKLLDADPSWCLNPEELLRDPGPNIKSLAWAVRMHREGNLYGAASAYNEILKRHPDHPDLLHLMGLLLAEAGKLPRALEFLQRANELRPNDEVYCLSLGTVYRQNGRMSEALDALSRSTTLNPQLTEAWVTLGGTLSEVGQFEGAISVFREGLEARPTSVPLLMGLADSLLVQDRLEDASEAYKHVLMTDPYNNDGYARLAATLVASGKEDAAATLFNNSLLLDITPLRRIPGWKDIKAFNAHLAQWLYRSWSENADESSHMFEQESIEDEDLVSIKDQEKSARTQFDVDDTEDKNQKSEGGLAVHRQDILQASIIAAQLDETGLHEAERLAGFVDVEKASSSFIAPIEVDPVDVENQALAGLDAALAFQAEQHLKRLASSDHPYGEFVPKHWNLVNGKALRVEDLVGWRYGGGGYLSGLYIAETGGPPTDDDTYAGWLEFGPPKGDNQFTDQVGTRVCPSPGLILLFPSWFWHRLVPPPEKNNLRWIALGFELVTEEPKAREEVISKDNSKIASTQSNIVNQSDVEDSSKILTGAKSGYPADK